MLSNPSFFSECIGVFGVFLRQLFARNHQAAWSGARSKHSFWSISERRSSSNVKRQNRALTTWHQLSIWWEGWRKWTLWYIWRRFASFGYFQGCKTAFLPCFNLFSRARTLTNEIFCLSLSSVREKKGFSSLIYAPIVCEYLPKMTMIEALVNEWKSLQPLKEDASRLRRHHTVASAS